MFIKAMKSAAGFLGRRLLVAHLVGLLVTMPVMVPMTGCTTSATQVQQDGAALAQALNSIAALETQGGNTAMAQQLTQAANALTAATQNFQTGSATAIISDAATAAEVALAAIPGTAEFAPLVPIAVAAIDALLANIGAHPAAASASAHAVTPAAERLAQIKANPPKIQHRVMRSPEGDFKATWKSAVKAHNLPESLIVK